MKKLFFGHFALILAQEKPGDWSGWSDWSACENDVYNRIRRCYGDNMEGKSGMGREKITNYII